MNTRDKSELRKKKNRGRLRIILIAAVVFFLLGYGYYGWALVMAFFFYVCHEVLWSDHIFYDPGRDYQYRFTDTKELPVSWDSKNKILNIPPLSEDVDTALLALTIKSDLLGGLFDPLIEFCVGDEQIIQYFERNVKGLRYINISPLLKAVNAGGSITVKTKYCKVMELQGKLFAFKNPDLNNKKLLVISPHADDGELAAFGLYSEHESCLVTMTAGEVEAEDFQNIYHDKQQASLLKGRLRSLDGMTAAIWGGIDPKNMINLGYFCQRLKEMHDAPEQLKGSKTAGVTDTRLFRQPNQQPLKSDQNGMPTWSNLIEDLREIIKQANPDIIVSPHPQLDPHGDHIYATRAVLEAISGLEKQPENIYYYANHLRHTDHYPFGPVHTVVSLPPNFDSIVVSSIVSYPLEMKKQKDKIFALEVMHDLKTKLTLKKRIRRILQSLLINRPINQYGEDEFYRKTIRVNELFYRVKTADAVKWIDKG